LAKMSPEARAAYQSRIARRRKQKAMMAARKKAEAQRKAKAKAAKKITVKVGAVEATIDAGADKTFGTEDDTVKLAKAGTAGYRTMLVKQLREIAKDRSIPGCGKMTKANLVKALRKHDKAQG